MADGLKLALFGLHRGGSAEPDTLARRARLAEEVGFESFWIGDHVALPSAETQGGDPPAQPRLEAVVALAYMAALTSRVRLAIGVIVLPQRQPVLLAKQLSTIDVLSKGRLIVGIGVGYLEPELRALGASLADRGARTDEYLAAMRALWDEPDPVVRGALRLLRWCHRAAAAGPAAASADRDRRAFAGGVPPRDPGRERLARVGPGPRADRPGAGGASRDREPPRTPGGARQARDHDHATRHP